MLHYEISGNGTENLVLLHGLMENSGMWKEMEPLLSEKFKLIKIDLPGHGKSEISGEIHTVELMAEKVNQVTNELTLSDFHLLGHSMGGYTALAFAEKFPETLKTLTLFFSTYLPDDEEKKQTRKKSFRLIENEYEKYVNASVPIPFNPYEKEELKDKIETARKMALSTNNLGALAAIKGIMERPDRKSVLENFENKILMLNGRNDNAVDSFDTIKNLPTRGNIKSYLLDCGHNGHWERPEICAEIINFELIKNIERA